MAFWTIIGKGKIGDEEGKTVTIRLNTGAKTWSSHGASAGLFLETRSGSYSVITHKVYGQGTQLLGAGNKVAAFLEGLTGATAVGGTGQGHGLEKAVVFRWTLDSK